MNTRLYEELILSPLPKHRYKIRREIRYKDVIIPVGFETNGADIPRAFWSIYPPNRSDYLPAVVVHDYLCFLEDYEKADRYFKEILEVLAVSVFDVYVLWGGVRFYSICVRPVLKKIEKLSRGKIGVKR